MHDQYDIILPNHPREEGIDRHLEYGSAGRGFTEPAVLRVDGVVGSSRNEYVRSG